MKTKMALFPMLAAFTLGACCHPKTQPAGPLPDPISKSQQLHLLNQRAQLVQTLKARGGITVTWTDEKQVTHSNSADAVVLLRQRPPVHRYDPGADVLLIGKVAGSEVFEMGCNDKDFWTAWKVDPNTASIGRMDQPPANNPNDHEPLRADRVLTVLALTQIGESAATRIAMTANGEAGGPHSNELHIMHEGPDGLYIERTLVVDRNTGNITEIRTYFPDGRIQSLATLSEYKTGLNKDNSQTTVQFPGRVVVVDPSYHSRIELTMDSYDVNPVIPPAAFLTPDFSKQGLTVVPVQ